MADLQHLTGLINEAIAETTGDMGAANDLQAALLVGLGLSIAFASGGERNIASAMCDRASVQVYEQATLAACVLADAGRL